MHGDYFVKVTGGAATSAKRDRGCVAGGKRKRQNRGTMMEKKWKNKDFFFFFKERDGKALEIKHVPAINV